MFRKIRVVVADDSALMRKKITEILNSDSQIEVVATARNGQETLAVIYNLKPDVVTLDVEMPILDGLTTLGYIMSEMPTPCVMLSAFTAEGTQETIKALEFGAVDFVEKPSGVISLDIENIATDIIDKVKIAAKVHTDKLRLLMAKKAKETEKILKKPCGSSRVFTIASSTGGTQALATILPNLRADLAAAVLVVQHMPGGFTKTLAQRLNWQSKISVIEAENEMPIKPAQVIIAKGGIHMEVMGTADSAYISLVDRPPRLGVKPNADIMMESAAKVFGNRTVGVVLTGMGSDGTVGSRAIKSAGGKVLAEAELSCVIYGMPKSVIDAELADKIVPLRMMAQEMELLV